MALEFACEKGEAWPCLASNELEACLASPRAVRKSGSADWREGSPIIRVGIGQIRREKPVEIGALQDKNEQC